MSPTANTTYSVTVTSGAGCTAIASTTVTVNSIPAQPGAITSNSPQCGTSVTFTGGSCPGGCNCYWEASAGGESTTSPGSTPINTMTTAGTYTEYINAQNTTTGCWSGTVSSSGTVNAIPTSPITGRTTICSGNSTTLTASGGGTYLWSSGLGTNSAIIVSPTTKTTYSVTITSIAGCTGTVNTTVYINTGLPSPPIAGISNTSATEIVWNWSDVSSPPTSYMWGTTTTYGSAINNGTSSNYAQTGLTGNTSYSSYVWAYNGCGNSSYTLLMQSTTPIGQCGQQVWMTTNINYGTEITVESEQTPGQKWCFNDIPSNCTTYGGEYEWAIAVNIAYSYNF